MLNLAAFESATLRTLPYVWGDVGQVFTTEEAAREVAASFPIGQTRRRESKPAAEKAYRMLSCPLVEGGERLDAVHRLDARWQDLVSELLSPSFTGALATATELPLTETSLEVRASAYSTGCFLGPHTDRSDKMLSVILYLEPDWSPEDGGELSILRSDDPHDEAARIEPHLGTAALLVRSEGSWHQVLPVRSPRSGLRRSVLVHYWRWPPARPVQQPLESM
ncbi:2OG-Fe(II) oxygenase [Streptomyces sp. NPDC057963]|uniref:2OG-Fe(II) oxygenase n=1 Tax=Streptomyces sp. NPDC057963 TaxID=3346290 RepID=UPI0036EFB409